MSRLMQLVTFFNHPKQRLALRLMLTLVTIIILPNDRMFPGGHGT